MTVRADCQECAGTGWVDDGAYPHHRRPCVACRLDAPDDAPGRQVLAYVAACAAAWSPLARILGNARAADVARAIAEVELDRARRAEALHVARMYRNVQAEYDAALGPHRASMQGRRDRLFARFTAALDELKEKA